MPLENNHAFKSFSQSIEECYDEESGIIQEGDVFTDTDEKHLIR